MVDTAMLGRAQSLYQKFTQMAPAPNVFRVATSKETAANANQSFPVQLGSTDPEDMKWALRNKVITSEATGTNPSVIPGVGQVIADDSFFDYAARKKEQEVLYDFYRFILSNADLSQPEKAAWWYGKFPWMRDLRIAEIEKQADLQKALARIQVTGPENEEDFMVLFLVGNGTIPVPEVPLTQMGTAQFTPVAKSFQQGFFSPFSRPPWTNTPIGPPESEGSYRVPFTNPISATRGGNGFPTGWTNSTRSGNIGPGSWRTLLGGAAIAPGQ